VSMNTAVETDEAVELKLDLGCGKQKKPGFIGVDQRHFEGVDQVVNLAEERTYQGSSLGFKPWPWADDSVTEIHMSHVLEHFTGVQRVHIFNEMYRVLVKGGKATIATPHWCSNRAYGDFTHQWPPVSEMLYFYISKPWRLENAPDNDIEWNPAGYNCDFEASWGHSIHQEFVTKHQDRQSFAVQFYKEACQDLVATLTKR
jgi:methyltransferase family protein